MCKQKQSTGIITMSVQVPLYTKHTTIYFHFVT